MVENPAAALASLDSIRSSNLGELKSGNREPARRTVASSLCDNRYTCSLQEISIHIRDLAGKAREDGFDLSFDLDYRARITHFELIRLDELQFLQVNELSQDLIHGLISFLLEPRSLFVLVGQ